MKTNCPFHRLSQVLIALLFRLRPGVNPSALHCRMLTGFLMCSQPRLLRVPECDGIVTPGRCYFALVFSVLWLVQSFCLLPEGPEPWGRGVITVCPVCDWAFLHHLLSALWPVVSLFVSHRLLQKGTSLMRSEICTELLVELYRFRGQFGTCVWRDQLWLRTPSPCSQHKRDFFVPEGQKAENNKDKR